jgi:hypothetical protein
VKLTVTRVEVFAVTADDLLAGNGKQPLLFITDAFVFLSLIASVRLVTSGNSWNTYD